MSEPKPKIPDQTCDRWPNVPTEHWGLARDMRKAPTPAEHILWQCLRGNRLGAQFRRQHPLGPYITDFCCAEAKLVIEVDGDVHDEPGQVEHDRAKDEYLSVLGYTILRFRNERVLDYLDHVVKEIEAQMKRAG